MCRNAMVLLFVLIGNTLCAQNWLPPEKIAEEAPFWHTVRLDPQGNAVALFVHYNGVHSHLKAATRPKDGMWSKPATISETTANPAICACLCIDHEGNAVAIWNFPDGKGYPKKLNSKETIQAAYLPFGQSQWIPTLHPLSSSIELVSWPCLALDAQGNALAAWGVHHKGQYYIETARLLKGSGNWTSLAPLDISYSFGSLHLVCNSVGNAGLSFMKGSDDPLSYSESLAVSFLSAESKKWHKPKTLAQGGQYVASRLVLDEENNALVTWQVYGKHEMIYDAYAYAAASGTWEKSEPPQSPVPIDRLGVDYLTVDSSGNATLLWRPDDNNFFYSRRNRSSSVWSAPSSIVPDEEFFYQGTTSMDDAGNLFFAWINLNENTLKCTTLPAGSNRWTLPFQITSLEDIGTEPCSALVPGGVGIVLYEDPDGILKSVVGSALFP